jgi:GNAT superfamily N-acetyltransferase
VITCTSYTPPGGPLGAADDTLAALIDQAWILRVAQRSVLIRPSGGRDLAAVARMHGRCSARSLLDRYRLGGKPPTVAALEASLRRPHGIVAVTAHGEVVATGTLERDSAHNRFCTQVGLLVEDRWQGLGIGAELVEHLAGVAQVAGFHELIAYPATALGTVRRLMISVGHTRQVADTELHLHTYLPDSAALGIGSIRQRLAG